jgi:hypothetical protein
MPTALTVGWARDDERLIIAGTNWGDLTDSVSYPPVVATLTKRAFEPRSPL